MIGTKDNSNLDKIFKNEDNKKNIIDYKKLLQEETDQDWQKL